MTNFEKYKDEILPLAKNNQGFAFRMNKITACKLSGCENCIFTGSCIANRIKWLYEEYQEPAPKLTKKERVFCEIVRHGYIARDENGSIACHFPEPQKNIPRHSWHNFYNYKIFLDENSFSFIEWKDEKPWSIEDLLKLEVEE